MFTTLIESTPHRTPNNGARLFSALFHSALIAAAVYATASGAASDVVAVAGAKAEKILWVKQSEPAAAPAKPAPKPKPKARPVPAPTKVPSRTPPIDPNAQATTEPESTPITTTLGSGGAPGVYNPFEVDVEVVAIASSIRPQYPEMLRAQAMEGQVTAQFVVNEKGRVETKTFKVISSTHPLFTSAVNRALPQMRFKPAKIGGNSVSQLVQQQFVFKMDR